MLQQKSEVNFAETCVRLHYRRCERFSQRLLLCLPFLAQLFLAFSLSLSSYMLCRAQTSISEKELRETVSFFRSGEPEQSIIRLKNRMPNPVTDSKFRRSIYENLPSTIKKLRLDIPETDALLKEVILPVLKLYARDKIYDVIIFRHSNPAIFSDSGVVLVISTGMIERAKSDDELVGFAAHEVGHEYFAKYSIYFKYLLKVNAEGDGETVLKNKIAETLAVVELECDAFAALTVSYLGYNPLAFIEAMERISRDFPNDSIGFHPPEAIRRRLVEQIMPQKYLQTKPQISPALQHLKSLLENTDKQN
jgi:Zn-dependent protease with chaperone function